MKILQINKFYFEQGGAEHYMFSVSRLLEQYGHKVIPFAMDHERNVATEWSGYFPSKVETMDPSFSWSKLKIAGRMFYSFQAKNKIAKLIKETKPDIAHIHNIYHQISPSILSTLKKNKIPVVMTVHDYKLVCPNYILYTNGSPCQRCLGHKYYRAVSNRCLKNSYPASCLVAAEMYFHKIVKIYEKNIDLFIAPSQFVHDKLVEFGLDSKKISVLPHFVETKHVKPEYGSGDGYFLYVGRLKEEKGVDVLIKAMAKLDNDVQLKIVGTGPDREKLQELARDLNLGNVSFLGQQAGEEIAELFKNARAVVVPSRVWETFGLAAAETMAFGKPVIASNVGSLPELVADGASGLLFKSEKVADLARKMEHLIKNPGLAERMGRHGRERIIKLTSTRKHYQDLLKIYQKVSGK